MRFPAAGVATFAGLLLPAYCKLLLVELQDDSGGVAEEAPGSPEEVPQLRKKMKGGAYYL